MVLYCISHGTSCVYGVLYSTKYKLCSTKYKLCLWCCTVFHTVQAVFMVLCCIPHSICCVYGVVLYSTQYMLEAGHKRASCRGISSKYVRLLSFSFFFFPFGNIALRWPFGCVRESYTFTEVLNECTMPYRACKRNECTLGDRFTYWRKLLSLWPTFSFADPSLSETGLGQPKTDNPTMQQSLIRPITGRYGRTRRAVYGSCHRSHWIFAYRIFVGLTASAGTNRLITQSFQWLADIFKTKTSAHISLFRVSSLSVQSKTRGGGGYSLGTSLPSRIRIWFFSP